MSATICRHIKTNGQRCKSPSLRLSAFGYFHSRLLRRHRYLLENSSAILNSSPKPNPTTSASDVPQYLPDCATQNPIELDLPPVEDAESIQVSISLLIAALAGNRIEPKRAAVLLYGLQLASTNAKSVITEPYTSSVVRAVTRTKSGRDLATQEGEENKGNKKHATRSTPAPAPSGTPIDPIYKENLHVID
jgi:hypothetical protein